LQSGSHFNIGDRVVVVVVVEVVVVVVEVVVKTTSDDNGYTGSTKIIVLGEFVEIIGSKDAGIEGSIIGGGWEV
jgi:hypothetical protein